jgi:preprotein translocase subunit YajC
MGNIFLAATSKSSSSGTSLLPFLLIVVVVILLYYTMTRRSRQRQAAQRQGNLMPGQPVRTTGGMYGTVAFSDGDDVTVEVAPGVQIRMMRRAVVPVADASANGTGYAGGASTGTEPESSADDTSAAADGTASTNGSEPDSSADDAFDDRKSQDRNF